MRDYKHDDFMARNGGFPGDAELRSAHNIMESNDRLEDSSPTKDKQPSPLVTQLWVQGIGAKLDEIILLLRDIRDPETNPYADNEGE